MINCTLDIETIPAQGDARQSFIDNAIANYKPPSLSKTEACADLSLSDAAAKAISKAEACQIWASKFGPALAEAKGEHEWRKTGLDGTHGEIISIAWAVEDGEIISVQRDYTKPSELSMLAEFFCQLDAALSFATYTDKPFFIGHNIPFDLKFLFRRAVILGIKPPFELPFAGYHGRDFFDNMIAWCGRGDRISQDNLCKALGIEGKPAGVTGSTVWDYVKEGKIDEVVIYNKDDIDKARQIHKRLTFA